MEKRIVTQGGGNNLFKVSGINKLYIYQISGSFFSKKKLIGSSRYLEDAISIIKSYTGMQIKEIREW